MNTPLSPAEAVWNAYEKAQYDPYLVDPRRAELATALRAAADQAKRAIYQQTLVTNGDKRWKEGAVAVVDGLLNIAAELENGGAL